jgi:hypothetical protein
MDTINKIKKKVDAFLINVWDRTFVGNEEALVVGWFDVVKMLIFTALMFVVMGTIMDAGWLYSHNAPPSFYTESDISTIDSIYDKYRFLPLIAFTVIIFYIINYANVKGRE